MSPQRIQLSRRKGWRKPDGAIVVARPSKWGNPFVIGDTRLRFPKADGSESWELEGRIGYPAGQKASFHHGDTVTYPDGHTGYRVTWHDVREASRAECVALYREKVTGQPELMDYRYPSKVEQIKAELAGRDLACWCPLDQPCHADVLLELANPSTP